MLTSADSRHLRLTEAMLFAGVIAGVLVTVTSCLLAALRPGFDFRRHGNSLLVLGDWGWLQKIDFVLYGVLLVAFGIGITRAVGGRRSGVVAGAGVAVYGLGAGIVVGLNPPRPAFGFPPGTTGGYVGYADLTAAEKMHGVGGTVGFVAVAVACFAFARYFSRDGFSRDGGRGWAALSLTVGLSILAVCAYLGAHASDRVDSFNYVPTWVVSVMLWLYIPAVAGKLLADARGSAR